MPKKRKDEASKVQKDSDKAGSHVADAESNEVQKPKNTKSRNGKHQPLSTSLCL